MQGRYRGRISRDERRKLAGCGFSAAILAAPFIALLYSRGIGLGVLALALGSTVYFAYVAFQESSGKTRPRLMALIVVNMTFLVLTLIALVLVTAG